MSIVIEHLNYVYMQGGPYETKALNDVSLTINDGEFIGLIGHTGSGKSTLVQHLNGLIMPSSGRVLVDGLDLADKNTDRRAIRRRVGLVFQYPENQLFEETVAEGYRPSDRRIWGWNEAEIDRPRAHGDAPASRWIMIRLPSVRCLSFRAGTDAPRRDCGRIGDGSRRTLVLDEPCAGLDPRGRERNSGADQATCIGKIRHDHRHGEPLDG